MNTIRKNFLPFALPSISEEAIEEVSKVLRSGWITSGPKVNEFEKNFSDYTHAKYSIALNSATAGLHLALEAIQLNQNHAVITSSVTFTATVEVICYFHAQPILTDIDPINHLMTPETIQSTIERECLWNGKELVHKTTKKIVKAIILVHLAGYTCDMERILELSKKYNLHVIEDAAHAFPAMHKNKMIGCWSDITVFSFYATKGITTGEGGMLTTDKKEYAERIKLMRLHGINRDAYNRPGWYYEVWEAGYKYNLTDIAAAIGIVQLKETNMFWERRTNIAMRYLQEFVDLHGIRLPELDKNGKHSWHLFRIEVDPIKSKFNRDQLVDELKKRNIGTSLHFIPIFEHPYYKRVFNFNPSDYPNAVQMYSKILSIPLFAGMTDEDLNDVVEAVKECLT